MPTRRNWTIPSFPPCRQHYGFLVYSGRSLSNPSQAWGEAIGHAKDCSPQPIRDPFPAPSTYSKFLPLAPFFFCEFCSFASVSTWTCFPPFPHSQLNSLTTDFLTSPLVALCCPLSSQNGAGHTLAKKKKSSKFQKRSAFIEDLLGTGHCGKYWRYSSEQDQKMPLLSRSSQFSEKGRH